MSWVGVTLSGENMKIDVRIVSMHGVANSGAGIRDIPDASTVTDVLAALNLPQEETYAVLLNDMPVSIDDRPHTRLSDGDKFTIFPPIKGG